MDEANPLSAAVSNGLTLHALKGLSYPCVDEIFTRTTTEKAEWLTFATAQHAISRRGNGGAVELFALGPSDLSFDRMRQMIWRIGWFGDTSAALIANGGVITAGTDVNLFKATDGFWKKLFAIGTAAANQVTPIAANTAQSGGAITSAAQKAAILTPGVATAIFDAMLMDADSRITANSDSVILCMKALADALTYDVKVTYKTIMPWENVFEGVKVAEYGGYKVVAISIWDRIINAYENASTYLNKPYRAVFADPKNLQVGTNANDLISDLDVWFDHKERRNYIYATGKIGTMVLEDALVHLAY